MAPLSKFHKSALLVVALALTTFAAPQLAMPKHATHRVRDIGPNYRLEIYHPESIFETFETGIDHPLSKRDNFSLEDAAVAFIESHLAITAGSVSFRSGYSGDVTKHAYVKQTHDGVPFSNAVANVAFSNDNKVVSFGSSFVKPTAFPASKPSVSIEDAIATAETALSGTYNAHSSTIEFLALQNGSVALTHVIQIRNEEAGTWYEAFVDAHANKLVSVTDFVTKASYQVLPITSENLTQGFRVIFNPQNQAASPFGWHSIDGTTVTATTSGNNVIAFTGSTTGVTIQSSPDLNFQYQQNPGLPPTGGSNSDAARTNVFYVVNAFHDITYLYGFTEKAYNFQDNNFKNGGSGNDRVTASVLAAGGQNNADFSTPPDGQSGAMRLFPWNYTTPARDVAFENDIIVHECTHGLTNRMTGGGTGRCLQTTEAGGLGEGWSDALAEWTEHTSSSVPDYYMGQYVANLAAGVRTHPYSTSTTVNPYTYGSLQTLKEVHEIGEVWANILHNVYANLVYFRGWSATAHTDPSVFAGNVIFLHLFIDALALQPCNPTFLTARDAWIQADRNRYSGANFCYLWRTFAGRGLGVRAAGYKDDFTVPAGC